MDRLSKQRIDTGVLVPSNLRPKHNSPLLSSAESGTSGNGKHQREQETCREFSVDKPNEVFGGGAEAQDANRGPIIVRHAPLCKRKP
jgi:hypothetical protein